MPSMPENGMVHLPSPYPFAETIKRAGIVVAGAGAGNILPHRPQR